MKQPIFDYQNLEERIAVFFETQTDFLKNIQMSRELWDKIMNNHIFFNQNQITEICEILKIESREIQNYFFIPKIKKT